MSFDHLEDRVGGSEQRPATAAPLERLAAMTAEILMVKS